MDIKVFKQKLLDQLYEPYRYCMMCPLGTQGRTNVVFGEGNSDAKLMFIGEGPGADEDLQGRPFIGRSGKLLTKTLQLLGVERDNVFITNIVKCRPPNNRLPTETESDTCKNLFLIKQIKIIRPHVICTLGALALHSLIGNQLKITQARGKIVKQENFSLIPTYHPAYILRNPAALQVFTQDIKTALTLSGQQKNAG